MTDYSYAAVVERNYNAAYDRWLHCSEGEEPEAHKVLLFWRRLWFNS